MLADLSRLQLLVVTGNGRSGTSALLSALASRADVAPSGLDEAPFINHFVDFLVSYEDFHPERGYHHNCYKLSVDQRHALLRSMLFHIAVGVDPTSATYPHFRYVVAKTFPIISSMAKFRELFPGMRLFYIIRNGIEVVASVLRFPEMNAINFELACANWVDGIQSHKLLFSAEDCAVVRHDDLLMNPEGSFSSAFEHLGLAQDPEPAKRISHFLFNSSFDNPGAGLPVRAILSARVSPWLHWSHEERQMFRNICGATMEEFGYSIPEDHSPCGSS